MASVAKPHADFHRPARKLSHNTRVSIVIALAVLGWPVCIALAWLLLR